MKKIMLTFAILISLQLNGAATGFVRSSATQAQRLFTGFTQPTQRFMATQTPKFTCPTGRCASVKNRFSGMPRQLSNAWSQYRRPIALGILGLGGAGLAYNKSYLKNIITPKVIAEEIDDLLASEFLDALDPYNKNKELLFWLPGRNDAAYMLHLLYDLLDEAIHPDEIYGVANTIRTESIRFKKYIQNQDPDYYADFIKQIARSYSDAKTVTERAHIQKSIEYLFGGESENAYLFSSELQKNLNLLLEASNKNSSSYHALQQIKNIADKNLGAPLLPEWKKHFASTPLHELHSHEPLQFDRYRMARDNNSGIEGYWKHPNPKFDHEVYHGKYPVPVAHPKPWSTQGEFLQRLEKIEQKLLKTGSTKQCLSQSPSRFEDINVGNLEYIYNDPRTKQQIRWPEAFGAYYVRKFNVKPSKEFYDWVMNNPDGN